MATPQDLINLINANIVTNGNNEITAIVLNPILVDIVEQYADLIGTPLTNLLTTDKSNLVNAINEIFNSSSGINNVIQGNGIQIDYSDPNNPIISLGTITSDGVLNSSTTPGISVSDALNYLNDNISGVIATLGEIGNVEITNPQGGDILSWNSILLKWQNRTGLIDATNTLNFYNGSILEDHEIEVIANTILNIVTLELNSTSGANFLTLFFNGSSTQFSVPATIQLTAGSDTNPQENWVYIPESTGVLTASISEFADIQQVPIANLLLQSVLGVQNDEPYRVQAWTDHIFDDVNQGHLYDLNFWIRNQHAGWKSGCLLSFTEGNNILYLNVTSGVILQLHDHSFPNYNVNGFGSPIYIANDPIIPYQRKLNLAGLTNDANGDPMGAGSSDYYNLVIWGTVSEAENDCKLYCNLPSGAYNTNSNNVAVNDQDRTSIFSIPSQFKGSGFLISRLTIYHLGNDDYQVLQNEDLRGTIPSVFAGGGATGIPISEFTELLDVPSSYNNSIGKNVKVNLNSNGLEFTPDYFDFALSDENSDLETGIVFTMIANRDYKNVSKCEFSVTSAPTGVPIFLDVQVNGVSVFITNPQIETGQFRTATATTQQIITGGNFSILAGDDLVVILTSVGSINAGTGLKGSLIYNNLV